MTNNLLDCSICLSPFVEPHILPGCGHTFCKRCVQEIPKTRAGALAISNTTDSSCPLCRKRFHSWMVVPNFALQHVVTEGVALEVARASGEKSGVAFDLARSSTHANVAAIYRESGVPPQLAQVLAEEDHSIALRVYILDNSGSMSVGDGTIVKEHGFLQPTTRWEELKHMAMMHAEWNARLGVPSEFILLNYKHGRKPVDGIDMVRIDAKKGSTEKQISALRTMLDRSGPFATTPLTERLRDLTQRLHQSAPELGEKDRKLMLVLVTDGVPNGKLEAFANAIREIAREHPVHIVVRLCTSDDDVSVFYHEVDKQLELSLDILDDFQGEAKHIYRLNPWFAYPSILHTVREAGTLSKLLDFIDERPLTPMEVGLLAQLILRSEGQPKYPWQPDAFLEAVEKDAAAAPSVYCIRRRGVVPIINVQALRPLVHPGKHSLTGQVANAVGLGGVAEAWFEGRTLLDAFQHPKVSQTTPPITPKCVLCTNTTDGVYPHCCRTCQQSGGKEHGPSCRRRNGPPLVQSVGVQEILKIGEVPEGVCFLCARATDGVFPHCCRTCERSGGTQHGPTCERRHAEVGYPQARAGKGGQKHKGGYAQNGTLQNNPTQGGS